MRAAKDWLTICMPTLIVQSVKGTSTRYHLSGLVQEYRPDYGEGKIQECKDTEDLGGRSNMYFHGGGILCQIVVGLYNSKWHSNFRGEHSGEIGLDHGKAMVQAADLGSAGRNHVPWHQEPHSFGALGQGRRVRLHDSFLLLPSNVAGCHVQ